MHLDVEFTAGVPLRRQLQDALRRAIRSGHLAPGIALPPSRLLAEDLGVSRGVVVDSYSLLVTEGYLSARQGSATRVAYVPTPRRVAAAKVPAPAAFRYDLRPGVPDLHAFPRARWQSALVRAVRELPDIRLTYGGHRGAPELRNAVAEHIGRTRRVIAEPDNVFICSGVSHGMGLIWNALRANGAKRVGIEDPGWRWQRLTIERAGLEAVPIRVDADGLVVAELDTADVDAVIVTPAHQYPTGAVMTPARRSELVAWAQSHGSLIVEDDYDAEFRYDRDPVASLQRLAPTRVAFLGTTSKTFCPAARLAWLVAPARLADEVENELLVTGATPPTIDQYALSLFIEASGFERHLERMRTRYRRKRDILVESLSRSLPDVRIGGVAAGLHLLAWLPEGVDEYASAVRARKQGVGVHELHRHCATAAPIPGGFVIGYALPSASDIRAGVKILAEAVRA